MWEQRILSEPANIELQTGNWAMAAHAEKPILRLKSLFFIK